LALYAAQFQSLTGRLKTDDGALELALGHAFQSLTGRLKTLLGESFFAKLFDECFNPSQVG